MALSLLKLLGFEDEASPEEQGAAQAEIVREITDELSNLEPAKARYIAKFAYILSRAANADLDISEEETHEMERIVRDVGGLPQHQASLVVRMAKSRNLVFGGTDNYVVTREFSRNTLRDQKLALLDCLFAVSAAGSDISNVEDNEIYQISRELQLDHRDYIAVRSKHRDHLAVLKNLPQGGEPARKIKKRT